jgi:hypothetical protein
MATMRNTAISLIRLAGPRPQTDAALASALALANRMESPVGQHYRLPNRTAARHLIPDRTCPPACRKRVNVGSSTMALG